ncbi:MAG: DAK2 domain-containing protein, partial [Eggerthellaceae bacterium]|nr:DAK2 domain-containing protein [Eggerthellaceae bacterium]
TEMLAEVKTGEVTTAVKDSHDAQGNPIAEGDVIGIADGAIEAVTPTIESAVLGLLEVMDAPSFDTLTILAGEDMADDDFDALVATIEEQYPGLDIDPHRGEQPLYPIVMTLE